MRSVRLSLRTARVIFEIATRPRGGVNNMAELAAMKELERAMEPKRSIKPARIRKEAKKKTKKEEAAEIRDLVLERADGFCESCLINFDPDLRPGELDHFWGRGKERQRVENCWALCRGCHRAKTDNIPTRNYWLTGFALHCESHGYMRDAAKARAMVQADVLIKQASQLSRGEGP